MESDELKDRQFNRIIDQYLWSATITPEAYASLTDRQKDVIQVIKRAFKRAKYGYNQQDTE